MRFLYLILLLGLFATNSAADITKADVTLHPFLPGAEPYLIEIEGFWPSDCHPGNQKPIVSSYSGSSVLIEFAPRDSSLGDCSLGETQYSALVDMSALVDTVQGTFSSLNVTAIPQYRNTAIPQYRNTAIQAIIQGNTGQVTQYRTGTF